MRIAYLAHGRLPIPPKGWGAVEHIIWEYTRRLRASGHEVTLINVSWRLAAVYGALLARLGRADVIHVHQERALRWLVPLVGKSALIVETCHAAVPSALEDIGNHEDLPDTLLASNHFVLTDAIKKYVLARCPQHRVEVVVNGAEVDQFRVGLGGNGRAVCVGKLQARKRQRDLARVLTEAGVGCDFVGPVGDEDLAEAHQGLKLGEWTRDLIRHDLTTYSALVLVSDGEGQPLVVVEALAAGLCVVVSPESAQNLDVNQPFIFLVRDQREWAAATQRAIEANADLRAAARAYAEAHFDFSAIVATYVQTLEYWLQSPQT